MAINNIVIYALYRQRPTGTRLETSQQSHYCCWYQSSSRCDSLGERTRNCNDTYTSQSNAAAAADSQLSFMYIYFNSISI